MMRLRTLIPLLALGAVLAVIVFTAMRPAARAVATKPSGQEEEIAKLQAELTRLSAIAPNQPAVMTLVAHHFNNLWFAAADRNWPLADYYLGEVRSNLKWAVRIRPKRTGPAGEIDLAGIVESLDDTQLAGLQKAIHDQRSAAFDRAYDETAVACSACHQAIGKPYLRPGRPSPGLQFPPPNPKLELKKRRTP
jgi:hypothetical protein